MTGAASVVGTVDASSVATGVTASVVGTVDASSVATGVTAAAADGSVATGFRRFLLPSLLPE